MSFASYLAGFALWLLVYGSALTTALLLTRSRLTNLEGSARLAAIALLMVAALLAVHLVPGILGVLSRGTVAAASLLLLALVAVDTRRRRPGARGGTDPAEPGAGRTWEWAAALTGVAIVAVLVLAAMIERAPAAVVNVDALSFHLPGAAAWIQTGSFWEINQYIPDLAHGNYPQNGDLLLTSVLLPWHNDAFVRLVSYPLLAMAAIAVYAISIEIGVRRPPSLLAAAMFAAIPAVVEPATLEVLTDTLLLATLATGVLFLLRHWRTGATSDLLLGALGLGIAFGTKWYGVSSVVVVVAIWVAGSLLARRSRRQVAGDSGVLVGFVALAGGFWLLRNLIESGNPLFPVKVAPFGITIFDAPFDSARAGNGFSIAHYLGDPSILRHDIVPALWQAASLPAVLLGLAVFAALGLAAVDRRRRRAGDPRVATLALASLVLFVVYLITPYTALGPEGDPAFAVYNVRYLMPALLIAIPVAASLVDRLGRWSWVWYGVVLIALGVAAQRSFDKIGSTPIAQAILAVVLGAALLAGAYAVWNRLPRATPARWLAAGAITAVLFAAAGQALQTRFNDSRYTDVDSAFTWVFSHADSGHRIGIVGVWGVTRESPVWPLFGRRLGNRVFYVGPFRREMLRDYRSRRAFLNGLREQRDDLLLVAHGDPPRPQVKQDRWALAAGLRPVARSDRFTIYRLGGARLEQ